MTNYEWLTSNKRVLASFLNVDNYIWQMLGDWWCRKRCPYSVNGECIHDECKDTHSDMDIALMWFEDEHEE